MKHIPLALAAMAAGWLVTTLAIHIFSNPDRLSAEVATIVSTNWLNIGEIDYGGSKGKLQQGCITTSIVARMVYKGNLSRFTLDIAQGPCIGYRDIATHGPGITNVYFNNVLMIEAR